MQDFYEDLFEELNKYGEIECLNICDNLADHMVYILCDLSTWLIPFLRVTSLVYGFLQVGNVYVQFREAEHAAEALQNLTGRFYAG